MPRCDGFFYKVQEGDTIVSIARKNDVKLARLIAANPDLTNPVKLAAGEEICIPADQEAKQIPDRKPALFILFRQNSDLAGPNKRRP